MTSTATALMRIPSPVGQLEITADSDAILSLTIEQNGRLPFDGAPEKPATLLRRAHKQLDAYFAGRRKTFDLPLRFETGTEFQHSVWNRLAEIEFGEAVSYGSLGQDIGRAGAGRAVGSAVRANPLPLLVGCHRVLSSDGRITGYSGGNGIPTKAWLLDHEGIAHR
ncbi:methylated-DNA--[protein]-cysteine S-methyltransferase [Glaciibacter superstes]|uniref:methylated-DNA--[protein]-cysteine S-methyltransferase n=1 Tax=Glaciibacter superstes TaxID=501023 RepID=UPI0003FEF046|nr:methylated-DNA--[protein]-cysteine S-methyltransferase [Glaciibacter superstes]